MQAIRTPAAGRLAANIATGAFAVAMLLQGLLALGVLPSTMAWGGTQTELTPQLRTGSLIAAVTLGVFAYVIRRRAGLAGDRPVPRAIKLLAWGITAYLALNTVANFASSSLAERALFGPLSLILTASCLVAALAPAEG